MKPFAILPSLLLVASLAAQSTAVFPSDYAAVPEGPLNSPNLPLANGTSRVMIVHDRRDLDVPVGASITRIGFRQDATITAMDTGRALQLEIRMGYTNNAATQPATSFDSNYDGAPVTVFGPALFALPNLRDANAPLQDGRFFVDLTTPFVYQPGGRNLVVEYRVFGNSVGGASFNYRLDRADFFSPVMQAGAGCQHSGGGVPTLGAAGVRVGQPLQLSATGCPANSVAVVFLTVGAELLPNPFPLSLVLPGTAPACSGWLAPGQLAMLTANTTASGGMSLSYTVPNDELLNDLFISHQALLLDFFAPGGVVSSNGVQVQVGIKPRASVLAVQGPPSSPTGGLTQNYCPVTFFAWQ
ncbi:MAG: hypothetical protein H6835_03155 [Planctomycetes bacterium]|nr:hypothetical protein [Planctomycetota bacterium]